MAKDNKNSFLGNSVLFFCWDFLLPGEQYLSCCITQFWGFGVIPGIMLFTGRAVSVHLGMLSLWCSEITQISAFPLWLRCISLWAYMCIDIHIYIYLYPYVGCIISFVIMKWYLRVVMCAWGWTIYLGDFSTLNWAVAAVASCCWARGGHTCSICCLDWRRCLGGHSCEQGVLE